MTTKDEMLELAERCEKATGPSGILEDDIARAIHAAEGRMWSGLSRNYTQSLDAAMTLIPGGWHVGILTECDEDDFSSACLTESEEPCRDTVGRGVDMTLSLCAAALRARAPHKDSNTPGE